MKTFGYDFFSIVYYLMGIMRYLLIVQYYQCIGEFYSNKDWFRVINPKIRRNVGKMAKCLINAGRHLDYMYDLQLGRDERFTIVMTWAFKVAKQEF